jgi:hypothetical protein
LAIELRRKIKGIKGTHIRAIAKLGRAVDRFMNSCANGREKRKGGKLLNIV